MDPLEAIAEVSDLIFQHLIGRELISATEVSPCWDEVIGCSFSAMKKITIMTSSYQTRNLKFSDVKHLFAQSPRKYQNFHWTYCNFSALSENAKENFLKFLQQQMKSLEHLTVPCVIEREHIKLMLQMPNLKILIVNNVQHNIDFTREYRHSNLSHWLLTHPRSHSNICYYHQDLCLWQLHISSRNILLLIIEAVKNNSFFLI